MRRIFSKQEKLAVVNELVAGTPLAQVCREHEINTNIAKRWLREYEENPLHAFAGKGNPVTQEARIAEFERTIGKLYLEVDFLKKSTTSLAGTVSKSQKRKVNAVLYEIVQKHAKDLGAYKACALVGVSRNGYADWINRPPPVTNTALLAEIQNVCEMPRYGYRRVTAELERRGILVNHKTVLNIMHEHGLTVKKRRYTPQTTNSRHEFQKYPNLVKGLKIVRLNQVWVSDITYVRIKDEFAYLAAILDRFSRKCIGWNLSKSLDSEGALDALRMALAAREHLGLEKTIHHSDQGVQYACTDYIELLGKYGLLPSMSEAGNPYENAVAESFNKTFKCEEVYLNDYESFDDAYLNIEKFLEVVYNKKRLHSSIGYKPPDEFEQQFLISISS